MKVIFPPFLYAAGLCDTRFKGCTKNERERGKVCVSERERERERAPPVAALAAHGPLLIGVKKKEEKKKF